MPAAPPPTEPGPGPEELRWLHDKYERLAAEEGQLAGTRTSYFSAVGTVLVTGLIVVIADLGTQKFPLVALITFVSLLGLLISSVWALLLHRTTDAQELWRAAALHLEEISPPIQSTLPATINLPSRGALAIDLSRPYRAHRIRFSHDREVPWYDRVDPQRLSIVLPAAFLAIWTVVLIGTWLWYLGVLV